MSFKLISILCTDSKNGEVVQVSYIQNKHFNIQRFSLVLFGCSDNSLLNNIYKKMNLQNIWKKIVARFLMKIFYPSYAFLHKLKQTSWSVFTYYRIDGIRESHSANTLLTL